MVPRYKIVNLKTGKGRTIISKIVLGIFGAVVACITVGSQSKEETNNYSYYSPGADRDADICVGNNRGDPLLY